MNKDTNYYGIDISTDVFDVMDQKGVHYQFKNSQKGFAELLKILTKKSHCVMEATGYYHYQLAYFLLENHICVSLENPLSVKRFIQMKLSKIKTDKSDAKMICEYAQNVELKLWKGNSKDQLECLQIIRMLSVYSKQSTALKNKIHGEKTLGNTKTCVVKSINRSLKSIKKEVDLLEKKLQEIVKKTNQDLLTRLESIPGLGRKTSLMLIVLTDGFERFETANALCSYSGLTPTIRQSGSSIKGRPRISKMGNPKLRNLLFMCSFTACKYSKACKAIYDRIVAKGKSKKLALIAVCNKLLKQAFAIAKSGLIYDETYRSTLVRN
ncbi:MAG: IS110 family transposase [Flavobacterium sp.]|nr:MAG: IS110 family transposase [Flavobacterium sp.]